MQYSRRAPRHDTNLLVRYGTAREFVREYAENISNGGLFIKGAEGLQALQEVKVRIELPGYGDYEVTAEVVHIIPPEKAAEYRRSAGAGLAITRTPPGFDEALAGYLVRLGLRKDRTIMISDEPIGILIGATGYRVSRVPPPHEVRSAVQAAVKPVVAILVTSADLPAYRQALVATAVHDRIYALDRMGSVDDMIAQVDALLEG